MRTACVLGGGLASLQCARELVMQGAVREVHLFRQLHDPARSLFERHPFPDYAPATFSIPDDAGALNAAVKDWEAAGLVIPDDYRACRLGPNREFALLQPVRQIRCATGSSFRLLDGLAGELPCNVLDRPEILAGLSKESGLWCMRDLEGTPLGCFDLLVCSYDYFLHGTRKAAIRALLESVLPISTPVMRVVAGAVDTCAFAVAALIPEASYLPFDLARVTEVPELALAMRVRAGDHQLQGLPSEETWILVATPQWTDSIRPDAKSRWDKKSVTAKMLRSFATLSGCGAGRSLRPAYHWGGVSSITRCISSTFTFDADACLPSSGISFWGMARTPPSALHPTWLHT